MRATRRSAPLVLAAGSGSLLFLSDYPAHRWALQLVALIPWLWALSMPHRAKTQPATGLDQYRWALDAALIGLVLGLFYTGPLLAVTAFPWPMALGLGVYITGIWVALSVAAAYTLRWPRVLGALGVGAAAVVAEWLSAHAVPVWGTAQSFVRVWSAAPWAIQFVDITGTPGIVFVLVTSQALVVRLALGIHQRSRHAIALVALLGSVAAYDVVRWFERPTGSIRVAATGWVDAQLPRGLSTPSQVIVETLLLPMFKDAVDQGAVLVVSPETGFAVSPWTRDAAFEPLLQFARNHSVALAVGYFDRGRNDNRIALIDATGTLQGEYRKTHLIPLMEDYQAGDGSRVALTVQGHRVGGMICQDDNFTDIASDYGRNAYPLVVVPTNDWHAVKDYHLENSRMRPLENRYAIVRAATNGISTIVSARGEVLAERDHFAAGPGVAVADVPIYRPGSLHAWVRHGFVLLCASMLLLLGWLARRGAGRTVHR